MTKEVSMPKPKPRGRRDMEKGQRLLYHVVDAGYQLSVSPSQIWRLIEAGRLRPTRIGKRVLVSHAAILEFIAAATREAAVCASAPGLSAGEGRLGE